MELDPQRAAEGPGGASPEPQKSRRRSRAIWASIAVAAVAGLIGTMTFNPAVKGAAEHTDPTGVSSIMRAADASRTEARPAVSPTSEPAVSPSPSPSPSPTRSPSKSPTATPTPSPSQSSSVSPSEAPTAAVPSSPASPVGPGPAPTASPSALVPTSPEPSAPESSESDVPELGDDMGLRWVTEPAYVRSGPGTGFAIVETLTVGQEVTITSVVVDERWQQVQIGDVVGFIPLKYLTDVPPESPAPSASPTEETSVDEGDISTEPCAAGAEAETGLTTNAVRVLRAVCNEFPSVSSFSGYREDGQSAHSSGRGVDVWITGEAGWEVANWLRSNSGSLGIAEIMYAQRIWSADRDGEGWRSMDDRGSDNANFYDHVHVTVA